MKRIICAALTLLMLAMAVFSALPAAAADDTLTVTVNGKDPVKVPVGKEFVFYVGLYAGSAKIVNGQVALAYDPDRISFDPYTNGGEVEDYAFPPSVNNAGVVLNSDTPGEINYNFTKARGVAVFNDPEKLFTRFRFKATAAGTADISYAIEYMVNVNEHQVFFRGTPDPEINPYTVVSVIPSYGCAGDADGDDEVTVLDAAFMQRVAAGAKLSYNAAVADVSGDNVLSLKDAVIVRRWLAGKPVDSDVGEWLFNSDKA